MNQIMSSIAATVLALVVAGTSEAGGPRGGGSHQGGSSRGGSSHGKYHNYHLSHGVKFSHGYFYRGLNHYHWSHRYYDSKFDRYCYYDPCTCCYYYWCQPYQCYYPCDYTP